MMSSDMPSGAPEAKAFAASRDFPAASESAELPGFGPPLPPVVAQGNQGQGADDSLQPGTRIARYRIESLVASGGMGSVYLAIDERLGRHVAIKVLTPHLANRPDFRIQFVRESKAAAAVDHP